jgi:hypothetical protein
MSGRFVHMNGTDEQLSVCRPFVASGADDFDADTPLEGLDQRVIAQWRPFVGVRVSPRLTCRIQ